MTTEFCFHSFQHDCVIRDFLEWTDITYPGDDSDLSKRMWEFVNNQSVSGDLGDFVGFDFSSGDPELSHLLLRFSPTISFNAAFSLKKVWFENWESM
jgi:hypothetical protein